MRKDNTRVSEFRRWWTEYAAHNFDTSDPHITSADLRRVAADAYIAGLVAARAAVARVASSEARNTPSHSR
jgi:hypothetical protein